MRPTLTPMLWWRESVQGDEAEDAKPKTMLAEYMLGRGDAARDADTGGR